MKINIKANELVEGEIEFISLVKNGANRSPFKIIKAEDAWLRSAGPAAPFRRYTTCSQIRF